MLDLNTLCALACLQFAPQILALVRRPGGLQFLSSLLLVALVIRLGGRHNCRLSNVNP